MYQFFTLHALHQSLKEMHGITLAEVEGFLDGCDDVSLHSIGKTAVEQLQCNMVSYYAQTHATIKCSTGFDSSMCPFLSCFLNSLLIILKSLSKAKCSVQHMLGTVAPHASVVQSHHNFDRKSSKHKLQKGKHNNNNQFYLNVSSSSQLYKAV